jgi:threonylcarbamoyladenosine tRNA methylthiotransferase MtaB
MSLSPSPPRASLHTLGCRLNQSETALLEERLREAGYELVPFGEPADLAIINTCTVTHEADAKSRQAVRSFARKNPEAYLAVIGCYAQMGPDSVAAIPGVDLVVGTQEKLNVLDHVRRGKNAAPLIIRDKMARDDFEIPFVNEAPPLSRRANLKVQDGCDFMCSFCIIPFARGRARSRTMPNLLAEARALVERGAKELVLTGVNVGTYALDGATLVDVVDALNALEELARIRISSIEPTTVPLELLDRMAAPDHKLVPYLHLPLQSGSDNILQAMRRRYTRAEYIDFVEQAHDRVPGIGIGTDILVGFPGETDADFEDTLALLRDTPLFYSHVFRYSAREGAASVRMGGDIDPRVMQARSEQLRELSDRKTRLFAQQHAGQEVEVLFESEEAPGVWGGYTPNYLRVRAALEGDWTNRIGTVRFAP